MSDIPDNVIHWLLAASVPTIGGLFVYLIKRTFLDFEKKIETVFGKLESTIKDANDQKLELAVLKSKIETIENQLNGRKRRG